MPCESVKEERGSEKEGKVKVEDDEGFATDSTCATASDQVLDKKLTKS